MFAVFCYWMDSTDIYLMNTHFSLLSCFIGHCSRIALQLPFYTVFPCNGELLLHLCLKFLFLGPPIFKYHYLLTLLFLIACSGSLPDEQSLLAILFWSVPSYWRFSDYRSNIFLFLKIICKLFIVLLNHSFLSNTDFLDLIFYFSELWTYPFHLHSDASAYNRTCF